MTDYSSTFDSTHWRIHSWHWHDEATTVLQDEPFRISWFATQLVTFAYIIERTPDSYQSVLDDYQSLRQFAASHKRTFLPFGFQCGYALLPIYVGRDFSESLISKVQNHYKKRWCVFHAPSLFDTQTKELRRLEAQSFWGCIYRSYINDTLEEIADCLRTT